MIFTTRLYHAVRPRQPTRAPAHLGDGRALTACLGTAAVFVVYSIGTMLCEWAGGLFVAAPVTSEAGYVLTELTGGAGYHGALGRPS